MGSRLSPSRLSLRQSASLQVDAVTRPVAHQQGQLTRPGVTGGVVVVADDERVDGRARPVGIGHVGSFATSRLVKR